MNVGRGTYSETFYIGTGGTFNHNNGTLNIRGGKTNTYPGGIELNGQTVDFFNLGIRYSYAGIYPETHFQVANGSRLRVLGDLTLEKLYLDTLGTGSLELQGNLNVLSTYGSPSTIPIEFTGNNTQVISDPSNRFPSGNIIVNKSGGSLDLSSNLNLSGGGQACTLQNGTINALGFDFTINGLLTLDPGTTINMSSGNLNSGSLINNGTVNP